jgi:hypothetical protein
MEKLRSEFEHKSNCECCKNEIPFEMPLEIIEATKQSNLVIFAGAGVSTENKRCYNSSFYTNIKDELGVSDTDDITFSKLMERYCEQINGRKKLIDKIQQRFEYVEAFPELFRIATSFHTQLSTIHTINEIITTNWDTFFEKVCGATPFVTGEDVAFWNTKRRKVLKIHGTINNLGSLVITENDYERCYSQLNLGNIGALLKTLLATKVVVFVGYSFGDEDFNKIYDYLMADMKRFSPHFYMVTLDSAAKEMYSDKNITPIITDATYFISVLKKILIDEGSILNDDILYSVDLLLERVRAIHEKIAKKFSLIKYPELIYTLSYQDGLIHSIERVVARRKTGEYSCPGCLINIINSYSKLRKVKLKAKKYADVAYIDGYVENLGYLLGDMIENYSFSPYYLYGYEGVIADYEEFSTLVNKRNIYHKAANKMAEKFIRKSGCENDIYHHTPFL